jgi:hypothetical protein
VPYKVLTIIGGLVNYQSPAYGSRDEAQRARDEFQKLEDKRQKADSSYVKATFEIIEVL